MQKTHEKLTFENIGGGAARELFNRALDDIVANISDKNRTATATRKIILTASFSPDKSGAIVAVNVEVATKLAGTIGHEVVTWLDHENGVVGLVQKPSDQLPMFADPETKTPQ
jgi:hypothetical protein